MNYILNSIITISSTIIGVIAAEMLLSYFMADDADDGCSKPGDF